jgi:hypothetical protein
MGLPSGVRLRAIAAGANHSLAVDGDEGVVWAWGAGTEGELGNGLGTDSMTPVEVLVDAMTPVVLANVTELGAGHMHSLSHRSDGLPFTWGDNAFGQLGDGMGGPGAMSLIAIPLDQIDAVAPLTANVLRGVKAVNLLLGTLVDVFLDFTGAPAEHCYRGVYRASLDKTLVAQTPPGELRQRLHAEVFTYRDENVVPSPPNDSLYFYQLRGISPVCLDAGP